MLSDIPILIGALHTKLVGICMYATFGLKFKTMAALDKMSLTELEDLAAKLRHTIARNPGNSRMEQVELEDVKQWIAIRQNRDNSESEP